VHVFADLHTHTRFSHGKGTVEENVKAAAELGLEQVAITDHGPASWFTVGIRDFGILREIRNQAKRCARKYRIEVLVGLEANVIDPYGHIDVPPSIAAELDLLLVGLHLHIIPRRILGALQLLFPHYLARFTGFGRAWAREHNTKALIAAVENNDVDIVTHPGLSLSIDTGALAMVCARKGVALEINTSHLQSNPEFIMTGKEAGAVFAICSDAHSPSRVGDFARGVKHAQTAGLSVSQIINAR
jgi:putative hydrolase